MKKLMSLGVMVAGALAAALAVLANILVVHRPL